MIKTQSSIFFILICCFLGSLPTRAQPQEINRVLTLADSSLAVGEFDQAKRFYRQALQLDKHSIRALNALGDVAYAQEKFGEAGSFFAKTLENDSENLYAILRRGACYREQGKFKALILQKLDFDKAERHFERVLARDSTFQNVLFEYAQLQRLRKNYRSAISWGRAQKRLQPGTPAANAGLLRLYRYFIDNSKKSKVKNWLETQSNEEALWALGETLRLQGDVESASEIFEELLKTTASLRETPIVLSLAKIHYQQNNLQAGEAAFWRAVNLIQDKADAEFVFEDVKYILSNTEIREYQGLRSAAEYGAFFEKIWRKRNPLPASSSNARLAEHYRRLLKAEKDYQFDGVRSWVNNPDKLGYLNFPPTYKLNDLFNDKGLIYIRQGAPDDRAFTVNESSETNESWRYYRRGATPEMAFHFMIDASASGNNWRLIARIDDPRIAASRADWGPEYRDINRRSQLGRIQARERLAQQNSEHVDRGLSTDRHRWSKNVKPLEISFFTAAFRAPKKQTSFEIYFDIPVKKAIKTLSKRKRQVMIVEQGMALQDSSWSNLSHTELRKTISIDSLKKNAASEIVDFFQAVTNPAQRRAAFHAKILDTDFIGGYNFPVNIPAFADDSLALSDVITADDVAPDREGGVVKNGLSIFPNPSRRYKKSQPVFLYFEIYNLAVEAAGQTNFEIEYSFTTKKSQGGIKKLFGVFGGDQKSIAVTSERSGDQQTSFEYIALDLSSASKGDYLLTVVVRDKHSQVQREKEVEISIY